MTNEEIIEGCARNSRKHQEELYNLFAKKMYGVCLMYAKDRDEAQDILHDGFFKIFKKFNQYNSGHFLEGWIRKIIVNTAIDYLRKKNKFRKVAWEEQVIERGNNVSESRDENDIQQIIGMLPLGARTVFNLYTVEGYKHEEIAEKLEISISTSKTQFMRAKQILKNLVGNHFPQK